MGNFSFFSFQTFNENAGLSRRIVKAVSRLGGTTTTGGGAPPPPLASGGGGGPPGTITGGSGGGEGDLDLGGVGGGEGGEVDPLALTPVVLVSDGGELIHKTIIESFMCFNLFNLWVWKSNFGID